MAAPVTVGPGSEETFRRAGLRALRAVFSAAEATFPTRPNGSSLLLKQGLFERLLSGQMQLSSFPASDLSAAQGDVKHLTLEQLLVVWTSQGDLPAGTAGPLVAFLAAVDAALTEQLAKRLQATAEVSHLVQLIYGVRSNAELPEAERWLVRVPGAADVLLHLPSCALQPMAETPALVHSAVSKASANLPKERRKLHWEVQLCEKPAEFQDRAPKRMSMAERRASGEARRSLPGRGYAKAVAKAPEAEAASEEEETASEETDDEVKPGSRSRMEAAGLCTSAQAQALSGPPAEAVVSEELEALRKELAASKAVASEELEALRKELAASKAAEAQAEEACEALRKKLAASQAEATGTAAQLQAEVASAKESQAAAENEVDKLRAELSSARDAEATAADECAKLQQELTSARDAEAAASLEVEKLQKEVTSARDAEARAADDVARLEVEVKAARDAEAQALDEAASARQGTDPDSDLQWHLLAAKDTEANLREQLAEAKAAEEKAVAEATEARRLLAEAKGSSPSRAAEAASRAALQEQLAAAAAAAEDADRLTETLQNQMKAREKLAVQVDEDGAESFASVDSDSQGFVSPLKPSPLKGV